MNDATGTREDTRLKATGAIWGCATGMLGISIPIIAVAGSGAVLLPLAVVGGAVVATYAVWKAAPSPSTESLPGGPRLRALEERIANLETISIRADETLKARFKQLEAEHDLK
ncbi:hypothetical protein [Gloeobacter kilaueensis]|uniref:Uncharacterized protein n=1 Tax=Gloeobacter kilaueensis (strain ATCC BAA-2537 / CCAP 1431/1 / ULC 316 / JS1) TaxID=1183438 RepID=U5QI90_GLOK1|nr:hypothetical protein [Gloeobacter kilaueensis]AGY57360.1 hypothetical protein GKIL_1114 [Gloeobacter kilaueensis JS1]